MRRFGTQGPVNPEQHYIVARTEELAEFIKRVKEGRYIVIFAPRQTGKTTFFYAAMGILAAAAAVSNRTEKIILTIAAIFAIM